MNKALALKEWTIKHRTGEHDQKAHGRRGGASSLEKNGSTDKAPKLSAKDVRQSEHAQFYKKAYDIGVKARQAGYKSFDEIFQKNYGDDILDSVMRLGDDHTTLLHVTAGILGKPQPYPVVAWRYGRIPKSGKSHNFSEDRQESGVSVMEVLGGGKTQDLFSAMFIAAKGRPIIRVRGLLNTVKTGSDGEPLILDAEEY